MTAAASRPSARITDVTLTPVAFADPPLLNSVGVHEPWALRTIVQVHTDAGITGLGETYGDAGHLARMNAVVPSLIGADVFSTTAIRAAITKALENDTIQGGHGMSGMVMGSATPDRVFSPFEVAALDIQGKLLGLPVHALLGGKVRDAVPFSGYLFYKWAGHPGQEPDAYGEALTPEGIVAQAEAMVKDYGFTALKLKGGVFPPDEEADAIEALAARFPGMPLRLDPNAVWSEETSIRIGQRLADTLEYLEDPTRGIAAMGRVRAGQPLPLATNMAVVAFDHLPESMATPSADGRGAVDVILSDHHFWGGLRRSALLGGIAETWGLRLSMHSNSHLGISLAAMVHLAGATGNLDYACDTHWPWKREADEVIKPGVLSFKDGAVAVPDAPGLGVELDEEALARLHQQYLDTDIRERDDTGYMQSIHPEYVAEPTRW